MKSKSYFNSRQNEIKSLKNFNTSFGAGIGNLGGPTLGLKSRQGVNLDQNYMARRES